MGGIMNLNGNWLRMPMNTDIKIGQKNANKYIIFAKFCPILNLALTEL